MNTQTKFEKWIQKKKVDRTATKNNMQVVRTCEVDDGCGLTVGVRVEVESRFDRNNDDPSVRLVLRFEQQQHEAGIGKYGMDSRSIDLDFICRPVVVLQAYGMEARAFGDVLAAAADTVKAALAGLLREECATARTTKAQKETNQTT